jgi:ABC-2 type transport system permease protein
MRYPREIFLRTTWAEPIGIVFYFVVPIMLVTNIPARTMVKGLEAGVVGYTAAATVIVFFVSRRYFQFAMKRYRSASS